MAMATRAPVSMTPPPRRASCGQQTGETKALNSGGGWFYHTVSAATPTEKRRAKLFHQEAGEREAQAQAQVCAADSSDDDTASQQYVWSVGSSRSRSVRRSSTDSGQFERTREIAGSLQDGILARISTLRALCDEGFITEDEYERCVVRECSS